MLHLGLVDEIRPFVNPVLLGGCTPMFPTDLDRLDLRLLEMRSFASGVTCLRYAVVTG